MDWRPMIKRELLFLAFLIPAIAFVIYYTR
jgi:hypothetical protein